MKMQEANVGVFDDLEIFRRRMELTLTTLGHHILISAGTPAESKMAIDALEVPLDIALVDGTLDPNSSPMSDGIEIARILREKFGDMVTIVSVSGHGLFEGADSAIPKTDAKAISDFIDQLPDKR